MNSRNVDTGLENVLFEKNEYLPIQLTNSLHKGDRRPQSCMTPTPHGRTQADKTKKSEHFIAGPDVKQPGTQIVSLTRLLKHLYPVIELDISPRPYM